MKVQAQNIDITPAKMISDYQLSEKADNQIKMKMERALNKTGVSTYSENATFALVPEVSILSENTSSGIPPIAEIEYNLSFSVMNIFDGRSFATHSYTSKGKGSNKSNAIILGLKNINLDSTEFSNFLESSKRKIISYYEKELSKMLQRANTAIITKNYESALFILAEIPESIPSYQAKVLPMIEKTYKNYQENYGKTLLQKAKALWSANKDEYTASEVAELLAEIPAGTSAYKESAALMKSIDNYLMNKENYYRRLQEKQLAYQHSEKKAMIEAARAIGVAYGKNSGTKVILWR